MNDMSSPHLDPRSNSDPELSNTNLQHGENAQPAVIKKASLVQFRADHDAFRALVDASSDVLYRMNADWSEMHNLKGVDFITDTDTPSRTWLEKYIPLEDQPKVLAAIAEAVRTKSTFELEHRVLRVDGTIGWTFSRAIPLLNEHNEVIEWFGAANDISERKQVEALQTLNDVLERRVIERTDALHEREEKYHTLFQSIDEGFCIVEVLSGSRGEFSDYRFIEVNPAFERQTGLKNAAGKLLSELGFGDTDHWYELFGHVAHTGQQTRFEIEVKQLQRWYDVYAFPYGNGMLGIVFNDITLRRQAERTLRESQTLLQNVLSIETVGVLFFTLDGRITGANEAFLRMSKYSHEELLNMNDWARLTPPDFMEVTSRARQELVVRGATAPYEKQMIRKDGTRWWGLFAPRRLNDAGEASECIEFILDVTERKRAEDQLRQAVRSRDEFLSVAAHELKTPVTSLRGFAQVLLRRLYKQRHIDQEQLQRSLERIDQQSARLAVLVEQLLDISRLEAGRLQLNCHMTDLVSLVQNVASAIQNETGHHALSIHTPATLRISIDPIRIEQVLVNLLNNAVKFSPDGGTIDIKVYTEDNCACVSVTDYGIGVPAEQRQYIFERFYQAHGNGYLGGMGIGLYISRQIAELHHGALTAEFPSDASTRMVLRLPYSDGVR